MDTYLRVMQQKTSLSIKEPHNGALLVKPCLEKLKDGRFLFLNLPSTCLIIHLELYYHLSDKEPKDVAYTTHPLT